MTNTIDHAPAGKDIQQQIFDPFTPMARHSLFWRARYLAPSEAIVAVPFLFWLTETLRPQVVVTLGVDDAVPHFAVCQAVEKLGLETMCFGVQTPGTALADAVHALNDDEYGDFSVMTGADDNTVNDMLDGAGIDLLVVNLPVDTEVQDRLAHHWRTQMSDRGVIVFLRGGMKMNAVAPFLSKDAGHFVLDPVRGIVLAMTGKNAPEQLHRLCRLRTGQAGYLGVRNIFLRMGEAMTGALHAKTESALEPTSETSPETGQPVAEKPDPATTREIETLKSDLEAVKEKSRQNLLGEQNRRKTLEEKTEASIAALTQKYEAEIAARKKRDHEIKTHAAEKTRLQTQLDAAQADLKTAQDALEDARRAAAQAEAARTDLEKKLSQSEIDIALLGEEIGTLQQEIARLRQENEALNAARQTEVSELGTLLEQKDSAAQALTTALNRTRMRQAVLAALVPAQKHLDAALANRIALRSNKRARDRLEEDIRLISGSDLFDASWYKAAYPDIGDQDPARHFVLNGAYELRNPSAAFDSLEYHIANPDVTKGAIPALMHYLRHGKTDGRAIYAVQ